MAPNDSPRMEVYESLSGLESLRAEWEALLEIFPQNSVFSTTEWLFPWWRAFAGRDQLQVLACRNSSSRLIGLAPLSLTSHRSFGANLRLLRFMGDGSHDSDNLDLPVAPGHEAQFSRALLDWLESHGKTWDICRLNTLPAHSPVGNQLLQDLAARAWPVHTTTRPWSVIELPENWEAYLKSLSSKERSKIGLRTRRLEKHYKKVVFRRCAEEAELDSALEALVELHTKHWQLRGLPGTLHVPVRRQFYHELSRLLLARNRLEFWLLELDDKIVAAQFGLRYKNTVYSLQEGFDPAYSSDSVGYVLRGNVLKHLIDNGARQYDFLGGTDESKTRWGAEVKHYLNIELARPRTQGSLHLMLKNKVIDAKRWLRKRFPRPTSNSA
jgi:CelD/BcsL family acetyltransferase involved in cellulose biosynthesis